VGGIIFLALILAILWLLRRQRSRTHNGSLMPSAVPEPFLVSVFDPFVQQQLSDFLEVAQMRRHHIQGKSVATTGIYRHLPP
jgi:hypothetical protein